MDKETLIKWMLDGGYTNDWLAEKCDVRPKTVASWRSNRPIPSKAALIIKSLMDADAAKRAAHEKVPQDLVLEFSDEDFATIEEAALRNETTARKWAKQTLNYAAKEDMEKFAEEYQRGMVAEPPAIYESSRYAKGPGFMGAL